ncbi:protein kinase [Achlya hypogyna]|uniref:Protein kinase n=1 Tax=Achlya hypogyna TaxID=1202772 RepID=A0A1V9Z213_ACHHY|nr:protein kinase [Achlya hypogyna]
MVALGAAAAAVAQPPVTVYVSAGYNTTEGPSMALSVGSNASLPSAWDGQISSLQVSPGFELVGYNNASFEGSYMIWDTNTSFVGNLWNDRIRSYIVRPKSNALTLQPDARQEVVLAYSDANFGGDKISLNLQSGNLPPQWQKSISSLKVAGGFVFQGYDEPDASGNILTCTTDRSMDKASGEYAHFDSWNDKIVSYQITQASPAKISNVTNSTATTAPPETPTNCLCASVARIHLSYFVDTGAIVGSAIGAVAFAVLVGWCIAARKKKTGDTASQPGATKSTASGGALLDLSGLNKHRLTSSWLQLEEVVGYGSFAEVWRGTYNGEVVAAKKLQSSRRSDQEIQNFINEIQLTLSFECPSIIKVIGASWNTPHDLVCVMEFMDLGDLRDYLAKHTPAAFSWSDKLQSLLAVTKGLTYLHSLSIVHRDLKSRNVLLDTAKGTKLVDFGIAKEDVQGTMTLGVGTFRWMAPEVLVDSAYTVAADIYSFGVLLSELDTHRIPYDDMINPKNGQPLADAAIIGRVMQGTLKPTFTDSCPAWVKELAHSCLQFDPSDRPTIYQVAAALNKRRITEGA